MERTGLRYCDSQPPFLRAWLYETTTPPMPNHPDWTVDPVEETPQALRFGCAARPIP